MTGGGTTGGGSNSIGDSGGGPCRGHPEIINLLKPTGFVHQQI